ncbi:MAG: hypothetical protein HQK99_12295 [Nitrospirae bacterium]|nr:hypothetical protein [Nitrospirota bacterium]
MQKRVQVTLSELILQDPAPISGGTSVNYLLVSFINPNFDNNKVDAQPKVVKLEFDSNSKTYKVDLTTITKATDKILFKGILEGSFTVNVKVSQTVEATLAQKIIGTLIKAAFNAALSTFTKGITNVFMGNFVSKAGGSLLDEFNSALTEKQVNVAGEWEADFDAATLVTTEIGGSLSVPENVKDQVNVASTGVSVVSPMTSREDMPTGSYEWRTILTKGTVNGSVKLAIQYF